MASGGRRGKRYERIDLERIRRLKHHRSPGRKSSKPLRTCTERNYWRRPAHKRGWGRKESRRNTVPRRRRIVHTSNRARADPRPTGTGRRRADRSRSTGPSAPRRHGFGCYRRAELSDGPEGRPGNGLPAGWSLFAKENSWQFLAAFAPSRHGDLGRHSIRDFFSDRVEGKG